MVPKDNSDAGIRNQALVLPGSTNFIMAINYTRADGTQDEKKRWWGEYRDWHGGPQYRRHLRYSSVLKEVKRRKFSPPIEKTAKRHRDEPSGRQRKRARSHSNFSDEAAGLAPGDGPLGDR